MDKRKKKIVLSAVFISLAVLLASGLTLAWFINFKSNKVGAYTVQVSSGEILQISLDNESWDNSITLDYPNLDMVDISGDGIPEIPQAVAMTDEQNTTYFTYWYSFDGEKLSDPTVTFTSASEQYYFLYPEKWRKNVIVRRDEKSSERTVRFVDRRTEDTLYSLRVFTPAEYATLDKHNWTPVIRATDRILAVAPVGVEEPLELSEKEWSDALHIY